jgi:hypothetical protein
LPLRSNCWSIPAFIDDVDEGQVPKAGRPFAKKSGDVSFLQSPTFERPMADDGTQPEPVIRSEVRQAQNEDLVKAGRSHSLRSESHL